MTRYFLIAAVGLALAPVAGNPRAGGGKVDPVKVEAIAGKPNDSDKQSVTVKITIDKGWHIYANPPENATYDGAATEVTIKAAGKAVKARVDYPPGKLLIDADMQKFRGYEENVAIPIEFGKTDAPVEVHVRLLVCREGKNGVCIPKRFTIKLP
jgi:DsbC/DsbD-like thiol-disulfide interchange protein